MDLTDRQDLKHEDMADPRQLNEIIWFSVKGDVEMPVAVRMPAFDLMTAGVKPDDDEKNEADDD